MFQVKARTWNGKKKSPSGHISGLMRSPMRIPHYLVKTPSGTWHFRLRMSICLVGIFNKPVIKWTLGTRELPVARDVALVLCRAYDKLHIYVRERMFAGLSPRLTDTWDRLHPEARADLLENEVSSDGRRDEPVFACGVLRPVLVKLVVKGSSVVTPKDQPELAIK